MTDCEVLVVEPNKRLSYSWNASGDEAANGLKTVVTWTLTPAKGGTLLRMEQSGFRRKTSTSTGARATAGRRWSRPGTGDCGTRLTRIG